MRAQALVRGSEASIWRDYSAVIGIDRSELSDYLRGATECSVLELDTPIIWEHPVGLDELRRTLRVRPAQSFRYLSSHQLAKLESLAKSRIRHGEEEHFTLATGPVTVPA